MSGIREGGQNKGQQGGVSTLRQTAGLEGGEVGRARSYYRFKAGEERDIEGRKGGKAV